MSVNDELVDTLVWCKDEYAIVHVQRAFGSGYVCYKESDDPSIYPNNFVRFMPQDKICFTSADAAQKWLITNEEPHL